MEIVKVTATQSHLGKYGMIKAGDQYETDKNHAAELKRNGLVEFDGEAAPKEKVETILVSDKPRAEKAENKTGNVPTNKKK